MCTRERTGREARPGRVAWRDAHGIGVTRITWPWRARPGRAAHGVAWR